MKFYVNIAYIHSSFGERISTFEISLSSSPSSYRYPFLSILFSILSHIFFSSDFLPLHPIRRKAVYREINDEHRTYLLDYQVLLFLHTLRNNGCDGSTGLCLLISFPFCSPRGTFWNPNRSLFRFYSPLVTSRSLSVRGGNCVKILLSSCLLLLSSSPLGMTIFLPCTHFQVVLLKFQRDFRILLDCPLKREILT